MSTPLFTCEVAQAIKALNFTSIFVLADSNTAPLYGTELAEELSAKLITIPAGDEHKMLHTLAQVWTFLSENGATRSSLLVNVGGGMVTDLGGFAASTFKRGIAYVNVATSLLGAVDASVGGKTGVNFCGLKNEIGVFAQPRLVVINTEHFATLPPYQLLSGYGEMIKHALLQSPSELNLILAFNIHQPDFSELSTLLRRSVEVKHRIVELDPTEKGMRKALNLGHTIGHAIEALALKQDRRLSHGHAVAIGLVGDLVLSHMLLQFPSAELTKVANFVRHNYPTHSISCNDYPELIQLMTHDKKSLQSGTINCTLLQQIGQPKIDCIVTAQQMQTALDITRDLLGN